MEKHLIFLHFTLTYLKLSGLMVDKPDNFYIKIDSYPVFAIKNICCRTFDSPESGTGRSFSFQNHSRNSMELFVADRKMNPFYAEGVRCPLRTAGKGHDGTPAFFVAQNLNLLKCAL